MRALRLSVVASLAAGAAIAAPAGAQETVIGPPAPLAPSASPAPPPSRPPRPSQPAVGAMDVSASAGWRFGTGADTAGGRFELDGAPSVTFAVGTRAARALRVELAWSAAVTRARLVPEAAAVSGTGDFDLDVHVVSLGATRTFRLGRVAPFAGASIGTLVLAPGEILQRDGTRSGGDTTVRLAVGVAGGADVPLSRRFAARAQARLTAPLWLAEEGLLAGAAGDGFEVDAGVPMVQAELGLGIVFTP